MGLWVLDGVCIKSKGDEKVVEKKIENYPLPFTLNPLLSPPVGLFISSPFEGCLIETGPYLIGGLGGLFNRISSP